MEKIENGMLGSAIKANVEMSNIVMDASADPNTFEMLSLLRICPIEKRLSSVLLHSQVGTGRELAAMMATREKSIVYITGNNLKTMNAFDMTEAEATEWLKGVLTEALKTAVIEKIIVDGESGVGVAAMNAAEALGLPVGGFTRRAELATA